MLSESALEKLSERLVNRIEQLNLFMINKLGEQLLEIGTLTPSQLREVFQSIKYGNNLEEIISKIAEVTNRNVKDIYDIFEEVAIKNQNYAKQFYDYKKANYIPYKDNKPLQELVKSIAKQTADNYINISKTSSFAVLNSNGEIEYTELSNVYQKITDEAIINITTGRESYEQQMRKTMRELSSQGIQDVNFASGYHRRMDSSVRMNVMDGVRTLQNELQSQFGKEFGADGVEVVHHKNPAPDHSSNDEEGWYDIDGRQFSNEEFQSINDELNRPVSQLNCYHNTIAIIIGISNPLFSEEELKKDKEDNLKGFEFQGKHYTNYEGTQLQRKLETQIRKYKDRQIGAKSINDQDEVFHCEQKISNLTNTYKELSDVSGLPTKMERLKIEGYKKSGINKKDNPKKFHTDNEILQDTLLDDKISTKKWMIPKNAAIENVTIIAGNGTSTNLKVKRKLEEKYGTGDWTKRAGTIQGKYYSYEIHYFESNGKQYEAKLKNEPKEVK